MAKYQSPMGLPDEHMRLVGIIAAHWEHFDFLIRRVVALIAGHDPIRVDLYIRAMPLESRLDLILAYGRVLKEDDSTSWSELTGLLQRIRAVSKKRNDYVHAVWKYKKGVGFTSERDVVSTKGGKFRIESVHTTVEEMAEAAADIRLTAEDFIRFCQKFGMLQP